MTRAEVIERLVRILVAVTDGDVSNDVDVDGIDSIRRLGLTSVTLLAFMVAVEDQLGVEWDDDVEPDVTASFGSMADYVLGTSTGAGAR